MYPRIFGTSSVRERPSDPLEAPLRLLLEAAQEMIRQRLWQQLRHKGDRNLATTPAGMVYRQRTKKTVEGL